MSIAFFHRLVRMEGRKCCIGFQGGEKSEELIFEDFRLPSDDQ